MKVIKPLRLGCLTKVFERDHEQILVVAAPLMFSFGDPPAFLPEVDLWRVVAHTLGPEAVFEECMPKLRGEVLAGGAAFPKGGVPAPACGVRLELLRGDEKLVDKTLYVIGDREWRLTGPTDAEPFTRMPLGWASAFGGPEYQKNPFGKGHAHVERRGKKVQPLPNVEDPKHVVKSPNDRPEPAGFGALDFTWPQRFSKLGTYDSAWLKNVHPGLATDLDWSLWNAAPRDQQFEGFYRGDETFRLENMHPDKPVVEGRLPGVVARCFLTLRKSPDELVEIAMRADTLHLFPEVLRGVLVFRGLTKVVEDDGHDVLHVMVGCEPSAEPRPLDHYRTVRANRLDKEKAARHALRDQDLMPPLLGKAPDVFSEQEELLKRENLIARRLRTRAEHEVETARATIAAHGLDPASFDLPAAETTNLDAPSFDELPNAVDAALARAEATRQTVEEHEKRQEAEMRAICEQNGVRFDEVRAGPEGGPPKFSADEELEKLRDLLVLSRNAEVPLPEVEALLADPRIEERLRAAEARLREGYRYTAHHQRPAPRRPMDVSDPLRAELEARFARKESCARLDLTGVDLAGIELDGADLSECFLERTNLESASLRGAKLERAVLAGAELSGADLRGAKLAGANLGGAKLAGANLSGGADLTGAILAKADFTSASLAGACLDRADLFEARLIGTNLGEATGREIMFVRAVIKGTRWAGAKLVKSVFIDADLEGADFGAARLEGCAFLRCTGKGVSFRAGVCPKLRIVHECALPGADFRGAELPFSTLRGTNFEQADFSGATLDDADLSECQLERAIFYRASAKRARFVRADLRHANLSAVNLLEAIVQKANIRGADFRGANLFRADFSRIDGDQGTNFDGANMKFIRFIKRADHAGG